ncbi:MAG: hypothetical protein ACJ77N_11350 [Chloroflexota bacterium]
MDATTQATGATDGPTVRRPRSRCLVGGCPCSDVRIVSTRRARFHASLAALRGETANRVIAAEPAWRISSAGGD